jgi:hypothetical protein
MTSNEFNSQYRLLKQIAVKGGRSYTAEHRASGRAVMVHILEENRVGGAVGLEAVLEGLSPRDRSQILSTLTVETSLVVVTQFLAGFEGFEAWLSSRSAALPGSPPQPAEPPPQSQGEFTRLFRSASEDSTAPPPDLSFMVESKTPAAPPPGSQFTDLFRSPATPAPPNQGAAPPLPPVRIVGLRVPAASEPPAASEQLPRLVPNLERNREATVEPNLAAGLPRPGDVIIRGPEPTAPPPPPPSWTGPSEYTRQLGSVPLPSGELVQPEEAPTPPEEPEHRTKSFVPLLLILNIVFIMATGLVVYFALRRC